MPTTSSVASAAQAKANLEFLLQHDKLFAGLHKKMCKDSPLKDILELFIIEAGQKIRDAEQKGDLATQIVYQSLIQFARPLLAYEMPPGEASHEIRIRYNRDGTSEIYLETPGEGIGYINQNI